MRISLSCFATASTLSSPSIKQHTRRGRYASLRLTTSQSASPPPRQRPRPAPQCLPVWGPFSNTSIMYLFVGDMAACPTHTENPTIISLITRIVRVSGCQYYALLPRTLQKHRLHHDRVQGQSLVLPFYKTPSLEAETCAPPTDSGHHP